MLDSAGRATQALLDVQERLEGDLANETEELRQEFLEVTVEARDALARSVNAYNGQWDDGETERIEVDPDWDDENLEEVVSRMLAHLEALNLLNSIRRDDEKPWE